MLLPSIQLHSTWISSIRSDATRLFVGGGGSGMRAGSTAPSRPRHVAAACCAARLTGKPTCSMC